MTLELKSYNIEIAEMLIIMKCIHDHPNLKGEALAKMLGIGKSNFYRKVKVLEDIHFRQKLINHGYTLKQVMVATEKFEIVSLENTIHENNT